MLYSTHLKYIAAFSFIFVMCLCVIANEAQAEPLRDLETRGVLVSEEDQLDKNVWSGLSRDEALFMINALPSRYASPVYFELAQKLLLSDAPSLPTSPAPKKNKKDETVEQKDTDRPDILIARIDKLLEMGALRAAENLYNTVITEIPPNFDLVFRSLEILMLRGQLSAACLDLQAMQDQFAQMKPWFELNRLCRIQFSKGAERKRLLKETTFEIFPALGEYLSGKGPKNLSALSHENLAFAVATKNVTDDTVRSMAPKAGKLSPLLLSVLYHHDSETDIPQKTCLAIEAVRRGILSTRELIKLYERPHYDSDLLLNDIDVSPAGYNIHPCMIPTVMYQRIASNEDVLLRNKTIRMAMDVMKGLPDAAFLPMAVYFKDLDVKAEVNRPYLWRVARILAYEKDELPQEWSTVWGETSIAPFWPIQGVLDSQKAQKDTFDKLILWEKLWPSEMKHIDKREPIALAFILGIPEETLKNSGLTGSGKNPNQKISNYENNNSLTFSRSYGIPSYGLTQRLTDVIGKRETGQSIILLLIGYGAMAPEQIVPDHMALILKGLGQSGLTQYVHRFALEVLK